VSTDLLANIERAPEQRPAASPERVDPHAGYWLGSAGGLAEAWRARALAAEREVEWLRKALARRGVRL